MHLPVFDFFRCKFQHCLKKKPDFVKKFLHRIFRPVVGVEGHKTFPFYFVNGDKIECRNYFGGEMFQAS